jgi:hypothetical protein
MLPGLAHFPSLRPLLLTPTDLTPVDTREEGRRVAPGVTENAKTPMFLGFFHVFLFYEAAALTAELRRQSNAI